MKIKVLLHVHSNIIEQKSSLIGKKMLGELVVSPYNTLYIKVAEFNHDDESFSANLQKIMKMNFQNMANTITDTYAVGRVVVHPPMVTPRGILVNYSRQAIKDIDGTRYAKEDIEKNMLFLKIVFE